jgi:hypothetical protein
MKATSGEPVRWIRENATYAGEDCLIWPFGRRTDGYGTVGYEGHQMTACRAMCIEAHGSPPEGKNEAAHSCGNGHIGCVSPVHLRWDDHLGNHADKAMHGTNLAGEKHNMAKLTEEQAKYIISMEGVISPRDLADKLPVNRDTVRRIQRGLLWKHLQNQAA